MNNLFTYPKKPDNYMQYTKQTLVSKCIALEELLIHNAQVQAENFDLQSRYQLLLEKYQSLQKQCTKITTQLESYEYNENRITNSANMGEKIEIYELEDLETIEKLNNFEIQVSELQLALQKKGREFDQLLSKQQQSNSSFKQYKAQNQDLVQQFRSSSSVVDHSSTYDDQEQIQVLQKEITRLNQIVCRLRYEMSDLKTREMDEEWIKGKQGEGHQLVKTTDSSFKVFNMIQ